MVSLVLKFLIVGGASANSYDAAIYDANTDTWKKIADTNYSRWLSSLMVLGKRIFVTGGETGSNSQRDIVEEYLADKDVWEVKATKAPVGRTASSVLSLPASWFDNRNLNQPFPNACRGIL